MSVPWSASCCHLLSCILLCLPEWKGRIFSCSSSRVILQCVEKSRNMKNHYFFFFLGGLLEKGLWVNPISTWKPGAKAGAAPVSIDPFWMFNQPHTSRSAVCGTRVCLEPPPHSFAPKGCFCAHSQHKMRYGASAPLVVFKCGDITETRWNMGPLVEVNVCSLSPLGNADVEVSGRA